jgi:cytochrome c oxidase cbb3-type subunit 2
VTRHLVARGALVIVLALTAVQTARADPTATSPPTPIIPASTRALYRSECAGCHGEHGDGKGQADSTLSPPPRDFTRGKFKLRTTNPRQPVTIDEIFTTLTNGIPGTAMPAFKFLSDDERRTLAKLVRSFAVPDDAPAAAPIAVGEPPATSPELVAAGREQYAALGCAACHGSEGKGDGSSAADLRDEWRNPAPPRNLISDPFRGGETPRALYIRMAIGMPGTPMPGYAEVADSKSLWALVAYLVSIRRVPALDSKSPDYGETVFKARHCRACHMIGASGGTVGPALDQVTERRDKAWLEKFLANPRPEPKLYPELPYRMPQLDLSVAEIDALIAYLQ